MTSGRHHGRRPGDDDPTSFAQIVDDVRTSVAAGESFAALGPGDLTDDGSGVVLRHLDGAICRRTETGLDPGDARLCVRGGADVFVNPAGYPTPQDVTCWPVESEFWIRHDDAADLAAVAPVPLCKDPSPCFDLFKGPDGEVVVMATGAFRWGSELATFAADGTTMPAVGVLLHEPMFLGGEGELSFHIAVHGTAGDCSPETIRWVGSIPRIRPR